MSGLMVDTPHAFCSLLVCMRDDVAVTRVTAT
jgi:hypothetical protein